MTVQAVLLPALTLPDPLFAEDSGIALAGRSTLLRAGLRSPARQRSWVARWFAFGVVTAAVAAFVLAVATVYFDRQGIAFPIYWLHDHLWLPLRGWLWTAPFPGSLIWLVPVVAILALTLIEFLGIWPALRNAQLAVLRLLVLHGPEWLILRSDAMLGLIGGRAGQIRAVVAEMQADAHLAVLTTVESGGSPDCALLLRLQAMLVYLDRATPQAVAAGLEAVALAHLGREPRGAGVAHLAARLAAAGVGVQHCLDRLATPPTVAETLRLTQALSLGPVLPLVAAVATLAVALAARRDANATHLQWFAGWARLTMAAPSAPMAQAEHLIAFEFWAALAEDAIAHPRSAGLLDAALGPATLAPRSYGEGFARFGMDRAS